MASSFPVLLTFDLDAESGALARDPENASRPVTLSVGQYGPRVAVPRLLAMLREERVPATFFVPGWVVDRYEATIDAIVREGHEVAHHGYEHVPPAQQSAADEEAALVRGVESIRRVTGSVPRGYRSPSWEVSDVTLSLLAKHGFQYSSNFMGDDKPYLHEPSPPTPPPTLGEGSRNPPLADLGEGSGVRALVELPIQWLLDDFPFFGVVPNRGMFGTTPPSVAYDAWREELEALHAEAESGTCFILTMHPQCIGRASRVAMLRRLVAVARGLDGVEFLRCRDLAERVAAR